VQLSEIKVLHRQRGVDLGQLSPFMHKDFIFFDHTLIPHSLLLHLLFEISVVLFEEILVNYCLC
jgi:hypothetical protein